MKRSEALQKIKEFNEYLDPSDDRPFEEQMLSFIEDVLGMLPPAQEIDIASGCYLHYRVFDSIEKTDILEDHASENDYYLRNNKLLWEP